jgi:glycosyltransferase involved in cell wall biosynthesis
VRVGFFLQSLSPEAGGGYTFEEDALEALMRVRQESPHTFVVLCNASTAQYLRTRGPANLQIEVLPPATPYTRTRDAALRCVQALRATLYSTSPLDRIARKLALDFIWFAGSGAHFTNLPYLTVVWDLQYRAMPWFPELSAGGKWDRLNMALWFLQRASAVVTGTLAGKAELEQLTGIAPERVHILPHPTPGFALAAAAKAHATQPASAAKPFLLYPAQFWPHKNHVNLILGFARAIRQHNLDLDLVLCGSDKGNRAHIERCIADNGLQGRVRIIGFIAREQLIDLYRQARALTYLSWGGPENLPPLEAFALGCPVIAANIAGAAEQLGDAALLVNPGDPDQIAEAIARLEREGSLRQTLVQRGFARAARWTGTEYVRGVFKFLDSFESIRRCWP